MKQDNYIIFHNRLYKELKPRPSGRYRIGKKETLINKTDYQRVEEMRNNNETRNQPIPNRIGNET